MYGGSTAIAAMQGYYLPSWISFVVDKARARQAGRTLFNTVYDYWSTLPQAPATTGRLRSLGAFGASAAFSSVADLRARTGTTLFVGPPNSTELWWELTDARAAGAPERLPVYGDGQAVGSAASPGHLHPPGGSLRNPQIMFLQHASDHVVWWSTKLIWRRSDWLDEPRGPNVVPQMHWFPSLTFWQITCDMIVSLYSPPGHGHHSGAEVPTAWTAVLHPPRWTDTDTVALASTPCRQVTAACLLGPTGKPGAPFHGFVGGRYSVVSAARTATIRTGTATAPAGSASGE